METTTTTMKSNKTIKIIHWVVTSLLSLMLLGSTSAYILATDQIMETLTPMGLPVWILIPIGIGKVLAIIAILTKKSQTLKEWAYAGLFFTFTMAVAGHTYAADGEQYGAIMAMVLLLTSYFTDRKMRAA